MKRRGISSEMLYTRDIVYEAYFKPHYLAVKKPETSNDALSVRRIKREEIEKEGLSVIIQNNGGREALAYSFVITFSDPKVQVSDVQADTMKPSYFYTEAKDVMPDKYKLLVVPEPIINKYNSIGLSCCNVVLGGGGLLAGEFELVHLAIEINDPCPEQFEICFHIDYSGIFPRGIVRRQRVVLGP